MCVLVALGQQPLSPQDMSFEGFRVSLSLGQGMFGKVHRAVRLRDNLECVIKQVPLGGLTVEEVEDVCNEV